MTDYESTTISTGLDRDGVFGLLVSTVPELDWRRGESEAQGALTVTGRNALGARVTFWFDDDLAGQTTVEVSLRGAKADADGSDAWQQALVDRLNHEVFPSLQAVEPATSSPASESESESGPSIVADLSVRLPPSGEDRVTVERIGDDLHLAVHFAIDDDVTRPDVATVVFRRAAYHLQESIPGRTALEGQFSNAGVRHAEVVDLGPTPFLQTWLRDPANAGSLQGAAAHHYFVMFWEAGVAHHVVAAAAEVR